MPNFHTNHIAIAANETDMMNVLKVIAFNLSTNSDTTGYQDLLETESSIEGAWNTVSDTLESWYHLAFTANPKYAEQGYSGATYQGTTKDGSEVSFGIFVAPHARPMSDEASVAMDRYGQTYVMQMDYDTAWSCNSDDVDCLFQALPKGSYGVAYLDADEGDGYEYVGCRAGNHPGKADLYAMEYIDDGVNDAQSLLDYANKHCNEDPAYESNMGKVALLVASCSWGHYAEGLAASNEDFDWDECDPYDMYDDVTPRISSSDHETYGYSPFGGGYGGYHYYEDPDRPFGSNISWKKPNGEVGRKEVDTYLLTFVQRFPLDIKISGNGYSNTNTYIDALAPRAPIVIKSEWMKDEYYSDEDLHVRLFDEKGNHIGSISRYDDCDLLYGLYCLTPYVKVTARNVDPACAATSRSRKNSHVMVHIELTEFDFNEMVASAHERFELPTKERACESIKEERC